MSANANFRKKRKRYERDRELQRQRMNADAVLAIKNGVPKYWCELDQVNKLIPAERVLR